MRLLITGGAGFVGSHLIKYLVSKGHVVTVVDNLHGGKMENLQDVKDKIVFHKMNILEYDKLKKVVSDVDGIFHEAALTVVGESFLKPEEYDLVNVRGTENIFRAAEEFDLKVVYASSSSVYGNSDRIPIKENAKKQSLNPYAETKIQAEILAEQYSSKGVKIIGLRYFNVYGKGQSISYAGVITKFLERIRNRQPPIIYGDGLQIRDFVYVDDVAKANLLAMESKIDSTFINIGSGKATSIVELAHIIIKASGLNMKPIHEKSLQGDIKESQADISFAEKMIRWHPEMKLDKWLFEILH